jgi:hypothetical protein
MYLIKRVVFRIYHKFSKELNKKTNNPILKWAKVMNRYFTQKNVQVANKHIKIFNVKI